jgi:hypothetical protein
LRPIGPDAWLARAAGRGEGVRIAVDVDVDVDVDIDVDIDIDVAAVIAAGLSCRGDSRPVSRIGFIRRERPRRAPARAFDGRMARSGFPGADRPRS